MTGNETPRALRSIITIIGRRNVGKSSLINAICGQEVAIVSEIAGTTTDSVAKPYELVPLGPVTFYDTAGMDDTGEIGEKRIKASLKVLYRSDMAVIVTDEQGITEFEQTMIKTVQKLDIPFLVVFNKQDIKKADTSFCKQAKIPFIEVSADHKQNIEELKNILIQLAPEELKKDPLLVGDLINTGDLVVLVTPIDLSAPKGRLILPQVQVLREILDCNAIAIVSKETELEKTLSALKQAPNLIITDSQVVQKVSQIVPNNIALTTFSTLFARYKGDWQILVDGAMTIDKLKDGDKILIAEACSHHAQDDDIGKVKIPNMIRKYSGKNLEFEFCSGHDFPDNLEKYALVIHCGACMLNRIEMIRRLKECKIMGTAITNYGMAISKSQGVFDRIIKPLKQH